MKLDSKTQAQRTADDIRALILNGSLKPGQPLRQEALSKQLAISRTPLRQGLQMLSEEGLVTITGFKGAQVAPIDASLLDDLFEMRLALEPMALALALPRLSKLDIAKAEMALDGAAGEQQPAKLSLLNWEFHRALYAPCKRLMLLGTIKRLNRTSALADVIAGSIVGRTGQSHTEHLSLLRACRNADASRANQILIKHLTLAHKAARSALKE